MYEKYSYDPEASSQAVADLYSAAAEYLDTQVRRNAAHVNFHQSNPDSDRRVSVDLPDYYGSHVSLYYDRPADPTDITNIDMNLPLFYRDDNGTTVWHTPIYIEVYNEGKGLRKFLLKYDGDPDEASVIDLTKIKELPTYQSMSMSDFDALTLTEQIHWASKDETQLR